MVYKMKKRTLILLCISLISACSHNKETFIDLLASDSQEEFHRNHNRNIEPLPVIDNGESFIGQKIKSLCQDFDSQKARFNQLQKQVHPQFADFIKENNTLLQTIQKTYYFKDRKSVV